MIGDWKQEDGNLKLIPQAWAVRGVVSSTKKMQELIADSIHEVNDELLVVGEAKLYDNYVRNGELDNDAQLKLDLGEGKTVDINLSKLDSEGLSIDEIRKAASQQ